MRRLAPGSDPGQAHRGRLPVRPERLLHVLAAAAAAAAADADAKLYQTISLLYTHVFGTVLVGLQ